MKLGGSWMARMVALAVVAMVGIAVMTSGGPAGSMTTDPMFEASAVFATNDEPAPECQVDLLSTVNLDLEQSVPEPVVVCLLIPQCWRNSDCDAQCGAGLGRCVHSTCPARICSCR
jgi:hypothetical protein